MALLGPARSLVASCSADSINNTNCGLARAGSNDGTAVANSSGFGGLTVAIRFKREQGESDHANWIIDEDRIILIKSPTFSSSNTSNTNALGESFAPFEHVFAANTTNAEVYAKLAKRMVRRAAIDGVSGTVFAYGQTSTGKTWSMQGVAEDLGIIPLAVRDLFALLSCAPLDSHKVTATYLEIYNDVISDLLDRQNGNLKIMETPERGIFVNRLSEWPVFGVDDAMALVRRGEDNRRQGATNMNERSSRSHAILQLEIVTRATNSSTKAVSVNRARLSFVDLAGSERVGQTGAEGQRLKEGGHINRSLLALGHVVSKLAESTSSAASIHGNAEDFIPYRDSKLTRILQPALDGRSEAALLCCVSPLPQFVEESVSTLKFAQRATRIQTLHGEAASTVVIEEPRLFQVQRQRDRLQRTLARFRQGVEHVCKRQRTLTESTVAGQVHSLREDIKNLLLVANHTFADVDAGQRDLRRRVRFLLADQQSQLAFLANERAALLEVREQNAQLVSSLTDTVCQRNTRPNSIE